MLGKARSISSGALSSSSSPTRKTSAPSATTPSRIPVASEYLPSSSSSARCSRSSSREADSPSRCSPLRQVSPPRKISVASSSSPASSASPGERRQFRYSSKSTENVRKSEEAEEDDRKQEAKEVSTPSPAKTPNADLSNGSGNGSSSISSSRIPLPKGGRSCSPPKQQQQMMPTLGWSFSPERMLREESPQAAKPPPTHPRSEEAAGGVVDVGEPRKKKFEAFVMTGDRMIQLAKTPANHEFKCKYPKALSDTCIVPPPHPESNGEQQHGGHNGRHQLDQFLAEEEEEEDSEKRRGQPRAKRALVRNSRSEEQLDSDFLGEDEDENRGASSSSLLDHSGMEPISAGGAGAGAGARRAPVSAGSPDTETNMSERYNAESVIGGGANSKLSPSNSSSPDVPEWSLLDSIHRKPNGPPLLLQRNASFEDDDFAPGTPSNRALTVEREEEVGKIIRAPPPPHPSSSSPAFGKTFTRRAGSPQKSPPVAFSPPATGMPTSPPNSQHSLISTASSEEDSDMDSLHSYHPPAKVVDIPSAVRLAKRLYHLDGFKTTDVSRHLSKNTDYNHVVAEEYLKFFDLSGLSLDEALRKFLAHFCLGGETQERERVLLHFSRRYLECNPHDRGAFFRSPDAVHTLTCAIMLLNTDLHGEALQPQRRMTCAEFIENLSELNDGGDFPRDLLKSVYASIKAKPIPWAAGEDDDDDDLLASTIPTSSVTAATAEFEHEAQSTEAAGTLATAAAPAPTSSVVIGQAAGGINPFLSLPDATQSADLKSGYVMRKSCFDADGRRTRLGRRSWKMFFATLRETVLYCFRDEKALRSPGAFSDASAAVRVHHSLAVRADDYAKKRFVFRLHTADRAQYLFQASDEKELLTWIDAVNRAAAAFSAPQMAAACEGGAAGATRRFQRPLLPSGKTRLSLEEQLLSHEDQLAQLREERTSTEVALQEATTAVGGDGGGGGALLRRRGSSKLATEAAAASREKLEFLQHETARYETYILTLRTGGGRGGHG